MEHPKQFSGRNRLGLTFQDVAREIQDVAREFPEMNCVPLARMLAIMVDKGLINYSTEYPDQDMVLMYPEYIRWRNGEYF